MLLNDTKNRLYFFRQIHDMTQKQWSKVTGISVNAISQIELGRQKFTLEFLHRYGRALGIRSWVMLWLLEQLECDDFDVCIERLELLSSSLTEGEYRILKDILNMNEIRTSLRAIHK